MGTEFNVDLHTSGTTVTVLEGRVLATPEWPTAQSPQGAPQASRPILLSAADRLVITQSGWGELQHGVNPRAATAWTENKLIFEPRPWTRWPRNSTDTTGNTFGSRERNCGANG